LHWNLNKMLETIKMRRWVAATTRQNRLGLLIEEYAPHLRNLKRINVDPEILLKAIACVESNYGKNTKPLFEKSYYKGGYYYKKSKQVRDLVKRFGRAAAKSYSSWQILFVVAWELGFRGTPEELDNDEIAIIYVIKFLNNRVLKYNPKSIDDIFDGYNSGTYKDDVVPHGYINKAKAAYKKWIRKRKFKKSYRKMEE